MKYFLKAVLVVFGCSIGLSSCEKEINNKINYQGNLYKGGEDTDGPIFVGFTSINEGSPVYPGSVHLYLAGQESPMDSSETDNNGNFSFNPADTGYYFIKVFQNSSLLGESGNVHIIDSTYFEFNM